MGRYRLSVMAGVLVLFVLLNAGNAKAASETAAVPIRAEVKVSSTYTVKVDPYLELAWNKSRKDYEGTYEVGVKGRIGKGRVIRIVPDEKFQMTSGKKTKTGTVKQEHTRWSMTADNSGTLVLSDKSYVKTSGTAAIKLPGTAVYHGGIQFTFSME